MWHDKVSNTNLKRRGVKWNTQSKKLIAARQKSWEENKDKQLAKRVETNKEIYNCEHAIQNEKIREKAIHTMFKNYGGWYNATAEAQDKKFKKKIYVLPSGKKVKVQGYEDKALDILLENYSEEDLIIKHTEMKNFIGKIKYIGIDNKEHRYFPDIYIKSEHKVIEVKSSYTYNADKETNELKKQACINAGINFEFMIL